MAMSVGNNEGGVNAEINITPLADVMLVLLIIFMITAPLSSHKIKVTLPQANPHAEKPKKAVPPIDLAVEKDGSLFWNDSPVTQAEMHAKLMVMAQKSPQPPLQIRADKTTRYRVIRKVLETAKGSGMVHVQFVTNAPPKGSE
ncbi:MAG TPA: biopolymer transporter ExbD [Oleiagrimonas sp.]|nr:biopolymer transporter ExbD [Oleiagrimonas sp.]